MYKPFMFLVFLISPAYSLAKISFPCPKLPSPSPPSHSEYVGLPGTLHRECLRREHPSPLCLPDCPSKSCSPTLSSKQLSLSPLLAVLRFTSSVPCVGMNGCNHLSMCSFSYFPSQAVSPPKPVILLCSHLCAHNWHCVRHVVGAQ